MNIEKEIIQMPDPEFPIKTYIVDNSQRNLSSAYHIHEEIEIIYMLEGEMTFWIGGNEVKVGEDKILFINSMAIHASDLPEGDFAKMCLLQFKTDMIYNINQFSEYKYFAPFLQSEGLNYYLIDQETIDDYLNLRKLLIEIVNEFDQKKVAYEISIKSILYRILTVLYRNRVLNYNSADSIRKQKEIFLKLDKVIEYVESHYSDNITVEKASELLNINCHYFCRLFKKATGSTFIQYLNFVRISVAEKLILTTNMSITRIIMETGFSSLSYFNRVFKTHKGCTPSALRNKLLQ